MYLSLFCLVSDDVFNKPLPFNIENSVNMIVPKESIYFFSIECSHVFINSRLMADTFHLKSTLRLTGKSKQAIYELHPICIKLCSWVCVTGRWDIRDNFITRNQAAPVDLYLY